VERSSLPFFNSPWRGTIFSVVAHIVPRRYGGLSFSLGPNGPPHAGRASARGDGALFIEPPIARLILIERRPRNVFSSRSCWTGSSSSRAAPEFFSIPPANFREDSGCPTFNSGRGPIFNEGLPPPPSFLKPLGQYPTLPSAVYPPPLDHYGNYVPGCPQHACPPQRMESGFF